jgi:hypothetical protein
VILLQVGNRNIEIFWQTSPSPNRLAPACMIEMVPFSQLLKERSGTAVLPKIVAADEATESAIRRHGLGFNAEEGKPYNLLQQNQ